MSRGGRLRANGALCRIAIALAAAVGSVAGCGGTPEREPPGPVPAVPIDLTPRCLELEALPPAAAFETARFDEGPGALREIPVAAGIRGWAVTTPTAARETIAWGFRADPRYGAFALPLARALLQEGLARPSPAAARDRVTALDGRLVVHVEDRWLWLALHAPPDRRSEALALLRDWIDVAGIDEQDFARTRRSTALAMLAEQADPRRVAERAFERLVPPRPTPERDAREPRERSPAGGAAGDDERSGATREGTDWTAEQAEAFLRETLRPAGSVLLVTTPVAEAEDPASWRGLGRAIGETAGAGGVGRTSSARDPLPVEPGAIHVVDRPGAPQVELLVGHATTTPDDPDAPALEMLASLIGGNVGGRLFRDLRERHGLAYIIDAHADPAARFVVSTRARPERVAALLTGIEAHLRALVETPLLACEAEQLRERMLGEQALLADDPAALRAQLRREVARLGAPRSAAARVAGFTAATRATLEDVARRHLGGVPVVVLVGDADVLRRRLAAASPGRPVRVFDEALETLR